VAQREYQRIITANVSQTTPVQMVNCALGAVPEIEKARSLRGTFLERSRAGLKRPLPAKITPALKCEQVLRRLFDAGCAAAGLAVLAPSLALIALAIKLDDGGPIFYSHFRVGKNYREFRLLKFRSMISSSRTGSTVTSPLDTRITRVGSFLRKYKLDELPQLWNVVAGDMQLVGARPQMGKFVRIFRTEYEELLQQAPGITDLASLSFRNEQQFFHPGSVEEQYITRIMPAKLKMSLKYSRSRTFLSDLEILFRTVLVIPSPSTAWEGTIFDPAAQSLSKLVSRNPS
jgi:lipopolysaccharide/colanic/teichoic acid biosynthesis glycosyltransferase